MRKVLLPFPVHHSIPCYIDRTVGQLLLDYCELMTSLSFLSDSKKCSMYLPPRNHYSTASHNPKLMCSNYGICTCYNLSFPYSLLLLKWKQVQINFQSSSSNLNQNIIPDNFFDFFKHFFSIRSITTQMYQCYRFERFCETFLNELLTS